MSGLEDTMRYALKQVFGFDSFRQGQLEVNLTVAEEQRDAFVLMATGSGKSVCYQLAPFALRMRGQRATTVVISPLVSLMQDQVMGLNARIGLDHVTGRPTPNGGPAACFLGSAQPDRQVEVGAIAGKYALVYLTPEKFKLWLNNGSLTQMAKNCRLVCFAVDECHCVSDWGHDFREEYREIASVREGFPSIPILALTASATPKVQEDILTNLKLRPQTLIIHTSFNRSNLRYQVQEKTTKDADFDRITRLIRSVPNRGTVIVYALTIKDVNEITTVLTRRGIQCLCYHGELSPLDRKRAHDAFSTDAVQVIVATIAFGMGIDKKDVRMVIHYGLPKSLEGYYQETGRAGRDGSESSCILFWSLSDMTTHSYHAQNCSDGGKRSLRLLLAMVEFAGTLGECRRRKILSYLGEPNLGQNSLCSELGGLLCDNCQTQLSGRPLPKANFTREVRIFLRSVFEAEERLSITDIIRYIRGDGKSKQIQWTRKGAYFGMGTTKPEKFWKELHQMILCRGLLLPRLVAADRFSYVVYSLSDTGRAFINDQNAQLPDWVLSPSMCLVAKVMPVPSAPRPAVAPDRSAATASAKQSAAGTVVHPTEMLRTSSAFQNQELTGVDEELFQELRKLRKELAMQHMLSPYMILLDPQLKQMAMERPVSKDTVCALEGMNEKKFATFGASFIQLIAAFATSRGVTTDLALVSTQTPKTMRVSETAAETLRLFNQGMHPSEIIAVRSKTLSTILNHICMCWRAGEGVNNYTAEQWDSLLQDRFDIPKRMESTSLEYLQQQSEGWEQIKLTPVVDAIQDHAMGATREQLFDWVKLVIAKAVGLKVAKPATSPVGVRTWENGTQLPEVHSAGEAAVMVIPETQVDLSSQVVKKQKVVRFADETTVSTPSRVAQPAVIDETQPIGFEAIPETPPPESINIADMLRRCQETILDVLCEPGLSVNRTSLIQQVCRLESVDEGITKQALDGLIEDLVLCYEGSNHVSRIN